MNNEHTIGNAIALLRKDKGLTQDQVAEALCVSNKTISKWESNAGFPSIEFLPKLSEILDTSISYLLTGKNEEVRYITIPLPELCAKNDDISLIQDVLDEKRKNFIDYIKDYESLKVFVALCERDKEMLKSFGLIDSIKYCILSNRLDLLIGKKIPVSGNAVFTFENELALFELFPIDDAGKYNLHSEKALCLIPKTLFEMIVCDDRIHQETLNKIVDSKDKFGCLWYTAYPYLIHYSYVNGNKDLTEKLLHNAKENNDAGFDKYVKTNSNKQRLYNFAQYGRYNRPEYGYIHILEETLKLALENSDIPFMEKFNQINTDLKNNYDNINAFIASEYDIKMAKLRIDNTVSREEFIIQSVLHDGIVCVEELAATRNIPLIKKVLKKYPISVDEVKYHEIEKLKTALAKKDFKTLFEYAVDNNVNKLGKACITGNITEAENCIDKLDKVEIKTNGYMKKYTTYTKKYEDICKKKIEIINDVELLIAKETATKGLNKAFFENEFEKNNVENLIFKLCIKLENILACDFKYEGTLSDMLSKYISDKLTWEEDDGWGYMQTAKDYKTIEALTNLRLTRNNLLHAKKDDASITSEQLKYCIDYICKLDGEV